MDDDFRTAMGRRILEKRKILRLSQEELAEKADTTKQTVSMAENGKRELSAKTVVGLAGALQMSTDYLLTGQCTNDDVLILNQKIAGLKDRQFRFLEDLLRNFIEMCEDGSV